MSCLLSVSDYHYLSQIVNSFLQGKIKHCSVLCNSYGLGLKAHIRNFKDGFFSYFYRKISIFIRRDAATVFSLYNNGYALKGFPFSICYFPTYLNGWQCRSFHPCCLLYDDRFLYYTISKRLAIKANVQCRCHRYIIHLNGHPPGLSQPGIIVQEIVPRLFFDFWKNVTQADIFFGQGHCLWVPRGAYMQCGCQDDDGRQFHKHQQFGYSLPVTMEKGSKICKMHTFALFWLLNKSFSNALF